MLQNCYRDVALKSRVGGIFGACLEYVQSIVVSILISADGFPHLKGKPHLKAKEEKKKSGTNKEPTQIFYEILFYFSMQDFS